MLKKLFCFIYNIDQESEWSVYVELRVPGQTVMPQSMPLGPGNDHWQFFLKLLRACTFCIWTGKS